MLRYDQNKPKPSQDKEGAKINTKGMKWQQKKMAFSWSWQKILFNSALVGKIRQISVSARPAWSSWWITGRPELHTETLLTFKCDSHLVLQMDTTRKEPFYNILYTRCQNIKHGNNIKGFKGQMSVHLQKQEHKIPFISSLSSNSRCQKNMRL